jgi:hypothetical protein
MATSPRGGDQNRPTRPGTAPRATRPASDGIEDAGETPAPQTGVRATRSQQVLQLEGRDKKINMIFYISVGFVVVLLAVLGMLAMNKTERQKRERAEKAEAIAAAIKKMKDIEAASPNDFGLIERTWKELTADGAPLYDELLEEHVEALGIYNNSVARKQTEAAKKEHADRLDRLEKDVQDTTKLDAVRREIGLVEGAAGLMGADYTDRVKKLQKSLYFNTLKKLYEEATAAEAATGGDAAAALKVYDDSISKFKREFDKGGSAAKDKDIIELYKQLLGKSDALVEKLITSEYIAGVPERDLLSPREDKMWKITEGVTRESSGREMRIKGVPGKDGKPVTGLVTAYGYDPINPWQDFVLDIEFTVNQYDAKGKGLDLQFRYTPGKRPYMFGFDKDYLEPGKTYRATYIVKASTVEVVKEGEQSQSGKIDPTTSRTGGFALAVENGVDIVISRCTVKVLRPKS